MPSLNKLKSGDKGGLWEIVKFRIIEFRIN